MVLTSPTVASNFDNLASTEFAVCCVGASMAEVAIVVDDADELIESSLNSSIAGCVLSVGVACIAFEFCESKDWTWSGASSSFTNQVAAGMMRTLCHH